ncbi:hypothetical protein [Haloglomus litoreum]|uniref:hypothetical protein n=1 Tax=Haloglomus litoreum TaxID=3034026 RepID=UPI0023E756D3|nr:hypothetical protein [Haloglomus sp. DT116]
MPATTPADRKRLAVRAIARHRSREDGVDFLARAGDRAVTLSYADRTITMDLATASDATGGADIGAARAALDELLASFPVFKIQQPETRKARDGTVYVSALADPKHAADFIEACYRDVFGLGEGYELSVAEAGDDGTPD